MSAIALAATKFSEAPDLFRDRRVVIAARVDTLRQRRFVVALSARRDGKESKDRKEGRKGLFS